MTERVNMATSETLGISVFLLFLFLVQADFSTENPGSPGDNCWGRGCIIYIHHHSSTVCNWTELSIIFIRTGRSKVAYRSS